MPSNIALSAAWSPPGCLAVAASELTQAAHAVTVSIGVAVRTEPVEVADWLDAADQAMFEAKRLAPGSVRVAQVSHRPDAEGHSGEATRGGTSVDRAGPR